MEADPPPTEGGLGLKARILSMIDRVGPDSISADEFDELALAVFAHQFERNPIYGGYCEARGAVPGVVVNWADIPAVPTDAFKAAPLMCGDPTQAEVIFRTSGTTMGPETRGQHYMIDTDLYRAALRAGFRHALLPDTPGMRVLSLVSPFTQAPDSSLSFMLDDVLLIFGEPGSDSFVGPTGVRTDDLLDALRSAVAIGPPVLLAGTSFAFVHLMDELRDRGVSFALPAGSRVMDTGGFKGRSREVGRHELYAEFHGRLGISPAYVVNEYGMTEMSSQLYDGVAGKAPGAGERRIHKGPSWVRSVVVDPETLGPVPDGQIGIVRHLDLANLDSVAALQTSDLGRAVDGGIELRGRDPGAVPRGCSIAMDELLAFTSRG